MMTRKAVERHCGLYFRTPSSGISPCRSDTGSVTYWLFTRGPVGLVNTCKTLRMVLAFSCFTGIGFH